MEKQLIPFLKWPGGKRWFTKHHADLLPENFNSYIEPFLGGGSVYFYLQPKKAILGDTTAELITTYISIRDNWKRIEKKLLLHQKNHDKEYYYKIRELNPTDPVEQAARLIYLNRTCFNGIYRVNLEGKFNVPKGSKDSVVYDTDEFETMAEILSTADLRVDDFEVLIEESERNDFVFADPPYTVRHNQNSFIKYNENLFSWNDQVRLANSLARAQNRGVKIVSTNANHQLIRELYEQRGFVLKTVSRYSSISGDPKSRKQFEELIILANIF